MKTILIMFVGLASLGLSCIEAMAQQSDKDRPTSGLPLEPIDTSKLGELSPAQFAAQIKECSATALLILSIDSETMNPATVPKSPNKVSTAATIVMTDK